MVQSSWGDVNVQTIKLPTQNGQWVVADLYKPFSATSENPAPLIIVIPGFKGLRKHYQISPLNYQEEELLSSQ